jgi:hypothetical protein
MHYETVKFVLCMFGPHICLLYVLYKGIDPLKSKINLNFYLTAQFVPLG